MKDECTTIEVAGKRPLLREIAEAAGLSVYSVSRLFSDDPGQRRGTTLEKWRKIARFLGVTLDELAESVLGKD